MKPNIVLVHGAWADGSMWSHVIRLLQAEGYYVTAVQNPLTSLADDVTSTRRTLAAQQGPVVLVGHSYGGTVITAAATKDDNVAALVYIAAMGLDEGESTARVLASYGSDAASLTPDQDSFIVIDRANFAGGFLPNHDPAVVDIMAAAQKPTSVDCLTVDMGRPAWKSKPCWYQVAENDVMIPPAAQHMMAERMDATTASIDAPHGSLVSNPKEVAQIIIVAANAVSR